MTVSFKRNLKLRKLLEDYKDSERYDECIEYIDFELNHLEIHDLDNYLLNLFNKNIFDLPNKNNSSIAYILGITNQKPSCKITTKGGTSPDIDTDFAHNKRELVLNYLKNKYNEGFSHIGTFSISQGRGLFKDICRIMEVPFSTSNQLAKLIPESAFYESVEHSLSSSSELKALYDSDSLVKEIVDMAREMEGCIKSLGIHAAGVILSDEPVYKYVPLFSSKDMPVTQFDAHTVEDVGFLKIDVLGLQTLSVIHQAFDFIKQNKNIDLNMENIPLDDIATYKVFSSKNTLGIFQMEAQMMTEYASKCNPKSIMEISNIISLVRPGPLGIPGCLSNYAKACNGQAKSDFAFPEFNHIFSETYGMLVYQEQLSRLSIEMCGFTGPQSDDLRKACAKKDRVALLAMKDLFVDGAVNKDHSREKVSKLFDDMEEFSRYSFCLAHKKC